jgi:hypothetical protein
MIHRLVSVLKAIEKRYKPGDAACERRSIHRDDIPASRRTIVQVITGHTACCAKASAGGCLQPSVKRLASTRNKLLKTMSIGLTVALPFYAAASTCFYVKAFSHTGM